MNDPTARLCHHGILAFGDSITNGGGELQCGVALQSWVQWVARGTGLPFTNYAVDGAAVEHVLAVQIPAFERYAAHPDALFELGCLYVGTNDVRALEWDPDRFERGFRQGLAFLRERCDRVLTMTVPTDLGRPRAGAPVEQANAVIERVAAELGALVVDLRSFGARNLIMVDHVHPTAFGQIAIAERALGVLAASGLEPRVLPSSLIVYRQTRLDRLRGDVTYVYRRLKQTGRTILTSPKALIAQDAIKRRAAYLRQQSPL